MMIRMGLASLLFLAAEGKLNAQTASPSQEPERLAARATPTMGLLQRPARLAVEEVSLYTALTNLQSRSGVSLVYSPSRLPLDRPVTCECYNLTVGEALERLLAGTRMRYSTIDEHILIELNEAPVYRTPADLQPRVLLAHTDLRDRMKLQPLLPRAQQGTIAGRVVNASTEQPLVGAQVVVVGTQLGARTGPEGRYTIMGVPAGQHRVQATYIGYRPRVEAVTVSTGEGATVNFSLEQQAIALEGIVAVGYGTQRRKDVTGAVSSVEVEELQSMPITSVTQGLHGRIAGVQVTSESGLPGAGTTIRIRGGNSIQGNNDPLYVVDGFPIDAGGTGDRYSRNPLSFLNPNDIASIEILKDASATAIYGARGANGVVLVTTKKGSSSQGPQINYEGYYGTQSVTERYDVLDASEFARMHNEALKNPLNEDRAGGFYSEAQIAQFGRGTDWADEAVRDAPIQNHQLSISGGNDATRYYVSGNFMGQEGVVIGSGFERVGLRVNFDTELSDRFRFGISASGNQNNYSGIIGNRQHGYSASYLDLFLNPPTIPVRDENGRYSQRNPVSPFPFNNPIEEALEIDRDERIRQVLANAFGEYDLLTGLKFRTSLGVDAAQTGTFSYTPTFTTDGAGVGSAEKNNRSSLSWLSENTLTYTGVLAEQHSLSLLAGFTAQGDQNEVTNARSEGFANDILRYHALQGGTARVDVNSGSSESGLISYLGRANYSFAERYLLTLTGRVDGSSRFGAGNKYAFFPSAAFAWRVTEEPFMPSGLADDLKLRVSYGHTGNQAIPPYRSLAAFQNQYVVFNSQELQAAFFPERLSNPDLRWEQTAQFDAGFDLSLFDYRVDITGDYYYKKTKDLLFGRALPNTSGFGSVLENIGALENRGVELTVSTSNLTGALTWDTDFNISRNRQRVLDLGAVDTIFRAPTLARALGSGHTNIGITTVGQPLGAFYTYVFDGIIQNEAELAAAPKYANMQVGRERLKDLDGDGVITSADRRITGTPEPDFILGFNNRFSYQGLDLQVNLQGSFGNELFNASRAALERPDGSGNVLRSYWENRWTGEGTSNTHVIAGVRPAITDRYVEDASYLRLRNVSLGFELPERLAGGLHARSLRLYVSATNLLTITDYSGPDPDINAFGSGDNYGAGIDFGAYPSSRTVLLGINVGL